MSNSKIEMWSTNLYSLVLTPNLPPYSSSLPVPFPLGATLSHLASNTHSLITTLEKHYNENLIKKCKFDLTKLFVNQIILNALLKTSYISASKLCNSFL